MVYYDGNLYMYGYSTYDLGKNTETGSELYLYNLTSNLWSVVETKGQSPKPRNTHYAYVYNGEMFVIFGMMPEYLLSYRSLFKFNFESAEWTLVCDLDGFRTGAASVLIGSKAFFLLGPDSNSVVSVDLAEKVPGLDLLSNAWKSPAARLYHASFVTNQKLYVFGGTNKIETSGQEFFNDLWEFDLESESWVSVEVTGSIPSPRSNFAFSQIATEFLFIFGGRGSEGYLNDMYYLHVPTKKWHKFTNIGEWPSARSHACLTGNANGIYVVGGKYDETGFNEIWLFDFVNFRFSLQEAHITWSYNPSQSFSTLIDCICWLSLSSLSTTLNLAGGLDISNNPNFDIIHITWTSTFYSISSTSIPNTSQILFPSETSKFLSGDNLVRVGGSIYSWVVSQNILIFNTKTLNFSFIDTQGLVGRFGHSAVQYKKSIYIFGGGGCTELYRSEKKIMNDFIKLDLKDHLNCSQGTSGPLCEPCKPGTYGAFGTCVECPKGKYNDVEGASFVAQCKLCPFGYYSSKTGAKYCFQCESGFICPIGALKPMRSLDLPLNQSYQPQGMTYYESFLSGFTFTAWYTAGIVVGLLVIVGLVYETPWSKYKIIDFFSSSHSTDIGVPVTYRKTSLGGLFTLIFALVSSITIAVAFISFQMDNVTEIKALVPVVSLENDIFAGKVEVNVTFIIYGGECVRNEGFMKCGSQVFVEEQGISFEDKEVRCEKIDQNCHVLIEYSVVRLEWKNSFVLVTLKEPDSFAGAISVNISSSSSIPDQKSGLSIVIQPNSNETIFKGSSPSEFFYKFTPSVFKSESSQWPRTSTGFHLDSNQNTVLGSVATIQT